MSLSPGQKLGAYEVVESVGKGGMGEVFRARDTKLGRDVAIKVLPESLANDSASLARFEREARLLASLNHPNIATLHGLEEHDGLNCLVMELVPGETLAERLSRGAIPVEEALALVCQIANALQAAHGGGILHRDLKPSNVKITPSGSIKLLDFGLGKALQEEAEASGELSQSPTAALSATRAGMILGTASYMSPEQARGKPVDARTDVWAFGCVLYEVLTGTKAFAGETVTDTIASVVKSEPDWSALPRETPPRVRALLERCLRKDPARRTHSVADARIEIEEAGESTLGSVTPSPSALKDQRLALAIAFTAGAVLAALAMAAFFRGGTGPLPIGEPKRLSLRIPSSHGVRFGPQAPVISPDGKHVLYVASRDRGRSEILLRSLDSLEATPIEGTQVATAPFFSPDSQWIGFFAQGRLQKVSLSRGFPVALAEAQTFTGGSWSEDGSIVLTTGDGKVLRVPDSGGQAETILEPPEGDVLSWPHLLPGGRAVLFTSRSPSRANPRIALARLPAGDLQILVEEGANPHYVETGHIVFALGTSILAVPFDLERLELLGTPVPVVDSVRIAGDRGQFSVSRAGTLLSIPASSVAVSNGRLVWVDRDGNVERLSELERPFTVHPRISPDGRRLAVGVSDGSGNSADVWLLDIGRESLTRLTFDQGTFSVRPLWSSDGRRVLFSSNRRGSFSFFSQPSDGNGEATMLAEGMYRILTSLTSDDNIAVFRHQTDVGGLNRGIGMLRLDEPGEPQTLLDSSYAEHSAVLSPDDRWLAYVSNESGRDEIYVRTFPDMGGRTQISTDGGTEPLWSRDGSELFYRSEDRMLSARILTRGPELEVSRPEVLFEGHFQSGEYGGNPGTNYDVAADGRFVMIQEDTNAPRQTFFEIILDWATELERRAPPP